MSLALFAGVRVRDYEAALAWCTRLLGEPSMRPQATEAVWELSEGRSIYVVGDERGDGSAVSTLFCDDLDVRVTEISDCGIEPAERETYSNGAATSPTETRRGTSSASAVAPPDRQAAVASSAASRSSRDPGRRSATAGPQNTANGGFRPGAHRNPPLDAPPSR